MAIALPALPDWWDSFLAGMELLASKGANKGSARNELVRLTSLLGSARSIRCRAPASRGARR